MTLWHVLVALSVVGGLGGVIYLLCSLPQKPEPPAVRVSPELLQEFRGQLIHDASKRILRADFQRGNRS